MKRSIGWARPRRGFPVMIDRVGDGETTGRRSLSSSSRLFRHWHRVRDGIPDGSPFLERVNGYDRTFRAIRKVGASSGRSVPVAKSSVIPFWT